MTNYSSLWQDDYWLLIMQAYLQKPAGAKPLYSKAIVGLSLELHLPPEFIYGKMLELREAASPNIKRLWAKYGENKRRLNRDAETVRRMAGFCNMDSFYDGVAVNESFEKDFRPIPSCGSITPAMLIMILDLYFRLLPATMKTETPEIQDLAKLLKVKADDIVEVMNVYQILDPYLNRNEFMVTPLLRPCQEIWQRYGNGSIEELAGHAADLKEYFS